MSEQVSVALVGPFVTKNAYRLVIEDHLLPHCEFFPGEGGEWTVLLDGRLAVTVPSKAEVERWGYILGHAMAIAAGYPCLGATEKTNPYAVQFRHVAESAEGETSTKKKPKLALVPSTTHEESTP